VTDTPALDDRRDKRRAVLWIIAIAALALATWGRIALLDHLRDHGFFGKYVTFADQILGGVIPRHRVGDLSPAYLWFTVALRALGLGLTAIRDLQVGMLSVAALCCALTAKRFGGWVAAVVAAVLILGNRAGLIVGAELEPEALIFLINAAAILAVVRRRWWVAGLLIGLSATARPVAMLTLILIGGWALLESRRALVAVLAAAAVPIAIVVAVNGTLTGNMFIMQPGSQLYEGNNPLATGCAGVFPRIVADIQSTSTEPDYLHVVYRIVAARAAGEPVNAKLSNRFWSGKAIAFMTTYPLRALELFGWKALLSVHHYDIYDLVTTKRKGVELSRYPAIPFGVAFVLSVIALALRRERRELIPVLIFAFATLVALVAFNVSSRQRNALLAPLAVLGGVGAAEIVALARARSERSLFAFAGLMIVTPLLGIDGAPMREDAYNWWSQLRASAIREEAFEARAKGDRRAIDLAAAASILDLSSPPLVSDATLTRAALTVAQEVRSPARLFDVAIALEKAHAWREAEGVLSTIEEYRPLRENRAVSSVAYYRARAAIHMHAPKGTVDGFLQHAEREAPGDANVLALRALTADPSAAERLDALYDPFTRDYALAAALADLGDTARADALRTRITRTMPEWQRPRQPF
jgi:hypothetical protein